MNSKHEAAAAGLEWETSHIAQEETAYEGIVILRIKESLRHEASTEAEGRWDPGLLPYPGIPQQIPLVYFAPGDAATQVDQPRKCGS
jgi:hypothetical protein